MRRGLLLAVGVAVGIVGLLLANVPGLAPAFDLPGLFPTTIAILALVAGLLRAQSWLGHEPTETALVERERRRAFPVAGDEIDARLRKAPAVGASAGDTRLLSVRQRLREAALDVLQRYQGYTEDAAETALDAGTWTDDRIAAEFFTTRTGMGDSVTEAMAGTVYGQGPFYRRATRAASEIERLTRGESE